MKTRIVIKAFVHDAIAHQKLLHMDFTSDFIDADIRHCDSVFSTLESSDLNADLLIVEVDGAQADQASQLQQLLKKSNYPGVVIVLMPNTHATLVRQLMRNGIHDVIPLPADMSELDNEIHKLIRQKQESLQSKSAQVITFMSAKGGAGSTTLAVNIGYDLAVRHSAKVCLIDLDLQFGDIANCLDLDNQKNIMDAIRQPERIDPVFIKALITKCYAGLDVLTSPSDLCDISDIDEQSIVKIIDAVCENYDYVLIDLPHSLMKWSVEAIRKSDRTLLVVQRSISYVRNAKIILDHISRYGIDEGMIELINNRDDKKTGMINHNHLQEMLNRPFFYNVRNNYRMVLDANEAGKPIDKISVGSGVNRDIEKIADAIAQNQKATKNHKLFSRMFHQ